MSSVGRRAFLVWGRVGKRSFQMATNLGHTQRQPSLWVQVTRMQKAPEPMTPAWHSGQLRIRYREFSMGATGWSSGALRASSLVSRVYPKE